MGTRRESTTVVCHATLALRSTTQLLQTHMTTGPMSRCFPTRRPFRSAMIPSRSLQTKRPNWQSSKHGQRTLVYSPPQPAVITTRCCNRVRLTTRASETLRLAATWTRYYGVTMTSHLPRADGSIVYLMHLVLTTGAC